MRKKQNTVSSWQRPLSFPIKLRDGHVIETMAEAAHLMTQLPQARQERPVWQHAAELVMQAHKGGKAKDIRAATDQLCRALQLEGWYDSLGRC